MPNAEKIHAHFAPILRLADEQLEVIGFEFEYKGKPSRVSIKDFGELNEEDIRDFGFCIAKAVLDARPGQAEEVKLDDVSRFRRRKRSVYSDKLNKGTCQGKWRELFQYKELSAQQLESYGVRLGTYLKTPDEQILSADDKNNPLKKKATLYKTPLSYIFQHKERVLRPKPLGKERGITSLKTIFVDIDGNALNKVDTLQMAKKIESLISDSTEKTTTSELIPPVHQSRFYSSCKRAYDALGIAIAMDQIQISKAVFVQYSCANANELIRKCMEHADSIHVFSIFEAHAEAKQLDRIQSARATMWNNLTHTPADRTSKIKFNFSVYPRHLAGPRLVWIENEVVITSSYRVDPDRDESIIRGHEDPAIYVTKRDHREFEQFQKYAKEIFDIMTKFSTQITKPEKKKDVT